MIQRLASYTARHANAHTGIRLHKDSDKGN